ncbi:hypothetical protein VFSR5_1805 [Aliivibrio fischeri SR5]|uniref:Uncharacterized protein n=1 Tax=Aliivibrio fischeri SR5 TaxID=1088719 RepID=A0AAV3ETV3_ALIFS|nr:hypothetical protein VFSR5_1805 [Aliivibrio fischeri SR5]
MTSAFTSLPVPLCHDGFQGDFFDENNEHQRMAYSSYPNH